MDAVTVLTHQAGGNARESAFEAARSRLQEIGKAGQGRGLSEHQKTQLREAAVEFEAVFLSQMIAPMFEGIEPDAMFGGGSGERVFQSMMIEEYGKALARTGGVGIADTVARQLIAAQEAR